MNTRPLKSYEKATVVEWNPDPNTPIIVISDIHGNLPFLQGLLSKIHFSPQAHLVLLGDMLEKGPESLNTLRWIMALEQTHQVHLISGNYEGKLLRFFEGTHAHRSFFDMYLKNNPQSLIYQMAEEVGLSSKDALLTIQKTLRTTHKDIWDWLKALPTMISTPKYLFVHGGIPNHGDINDVSWLREQSSWHCMKHDNFLREGYSFPKYVVVGHTPTTLYNYNIPDSNPIIQKEQRIISIDGACVLKKDGQLNALILEDKHISWEYYDGLPLVRVLQSQEASPIPINIRWGHALLKKMEPQGEFTRCLHLESSTTLPILTHYLKTDYRGRLCCEDSTDYRLPLLAGDVVSITHPVQGGFLGKHKGVTGWYFGPYELLT